MSEQREAIIEALLLGADRALAAEAAGVDERQLYRWINERLNPDLLGSPILDKEFVAKVHAAEAKGREHRNRTERMRAVVKGHDEAWAILLKRQAHFREARTQAAKGNQLSLIDP